MNAQELHKSIGIMNTRINDIIGKEAGGVHFGGYIEILAAIASIEEIYDLSYSPESESKRTDIMNIMINAMLEQQSIEETCHLLESKELTAEDARKIAFTEKQRIKNLADWYQYYGAGYKFFTADCDEDTCKECREAYKDNKRYPIEQLNMIPPLHGECTCNLVFYRK